MDPGHKAKIQQSIMLLQSILGGSDSSGPVHILIPGFEDQVNAFADLANKLEPEIKNLTKILISAIKKMQDIMNYSSICKKFEGVIEQSLQESFKNLAAQINKIDNPNFSYHCKAIREILGATFWVFTSMPEFPLKGGIEAADFNAIKFQKLKNEDHNEWYKKITSAFKILQAYVKKNYPTGLKFNFEGSGNWQDLLSGKPIQKKIEEKPSEKVKKTQEPKAPTKKMAKKELQGPNWFIGHFQKQNVTLGANQVQMKQGIFVQHCNQCVITIEGKFKSLQMNMCNNVALIVNSCISGVQVMNGSDITIFIKGNTPSITVEKCKKVRVLLNEENLACDVVTSKVSEFSISYKKQNGDQAKDFVISEQLITSWNAGQKKFETKVYDKFL